MLKSVSIPAPTRVLCLRQIEIDRDPSRRHEVGGCIDPGPPFSVALPSPPLRVSLPVLPLSTLSALSPMRMSLKFDPVRFSMLCNLTMRFPSTEHRRKLTHLKYRESFYVESSDRLSYSTCQY